MFYCPTLFLRERRGGGGEVRGEVNMMTRFSLKSNNMKKRQKIQRKPKEKGEGEEKGDVKQKEGRKIYQGKNKRLGEVRERGRKKAEVCD